ncbi:MAG TPA: DUF4153 domain-containing protein [Duganella sp.]|nr:DUF4153 domain-containing protein [Duganella sp.]
METLDTALEPEVSRRVMAGRLAIGLVQGLLLYWLYRAAKEGFWPAGEPYLFAPLVMLGLMLPVVLISSLGHMWPRQAAWWALAAGVILVLLSLHDAWRSVGVPNYWGGPLQRQGAHAPSGQLLLFGAVFLYIAHALAMAASLDGRRVASYATYFEVAWKLAVQLMFSAFFVAALWAVLWMGASLFELVKLGFLRTLLMKDWFYVPVICFAWSCAMHITDVRPAIVRGIRTLLLVLSSWILPVAALIITGFLCTLPFTGLTALWETRHATSLLLTANAVLIMLINAAFQNGQAKVVLAIRVSARTAALLLLPLTVIAVYALGLRVHDYGWTSDRIVAAACLVVSACYSLGYQWAGYQYDTWLGPISRVNVWTAFVVLAVLLALFTPLADPARLSVSHQMARLASGRVTADKFDYVYLRREGQRYGREALERFAAQGNQKAAAALKSAPDEIANSTPALIKETVTVVPAGAQLPAGFAAQKWSDMDHIGQPRCLSNAEVKCTAMLMDLDGDGKQEVLLFDASFIGGYLYAEQPDGVWTLQGTVGAIICPALRERLQAGDFKLVTPRWKALEVGGVQLRLEHLFSQKDCAAIK